LVRAMRAIVIALAAILAGVALAATSPPVPRTVLLQYGTRIPLSEEATQTLYLRAVELLESSQFNSLNPSWDWERQKIEEEYRQAMSGKYLAVTFPRSQKVTTMGGEISVRQIVIGLNRPDYASSLHTVDEDARVVGHGKYSGPLCVEFLKLVKGIAENP